MLNHIFFFIDGFCSSVEFEPCLHSLKNEPCIMTCKVPDFNQVIEFFCGGSLQGSCSIFLCDPNMIQEGGNTIYLNISSLSYASQTCEWTCKYGGSSSAGYNVTVYSKYIFYQHMKSCTVLGSSVCQNKRNIILIFIN